MIKKIVRIVLLFLLALVVLVVAVAVFGGSDRTADPPTVTSPAAPSTADAAPADDATPAPVPLAGIGAEVRDGAFAFVVTDVQAGVPTVGTGILAETAQGAYTIVSVTVTNTGSESQMFDGSSQKVFDAAGREFSADGGAAMSVPGNNSFLERINPGNSVTATVIYDLPAGTDATMIVLHDSAFSQGVRVAL